MSLRPERPLLCMGLGDGVLLESLPLPQGVVEGERELAGDAFLLMYGERPWVEPVPEGREEDARALKELAEVPEWGALRAATLGSAVLAYALLPEVMGLLRRVKGLLRSLSGEGGEDGAAGGRSRAAGLLRMELGRELRALSGRAGELREVWAYLSVGKEPGRGLPLEAIPREAEALEGLVRSAARRIFLEAGRYLREAAGQVGRGQALSRVAPVGVEGIPYLLPEERVGLTLRPGEYVARLVSDGLLGIQSRGGRGGKGLYLLDTSGSMGRLEVEGKALGLALVRLFGRWKRNLRLAVFGAKGEYRSFAPHEVREFLAFGFRGGTSFDHALARAAEELGRAKDADLILATDGLDALGPEGKEALARLKRTGVRLLYVALSHNPQPELARHAHRVFPAFGGEVLREVKR